MENNKDKATLISIVVPIYKVEPYLHKCVDSLLGQTYKNIEIILVDDGSPDNCHQICDEYAKQDKRVVVIHKENGGLADARNAGTAVAKGNYIGFIDSDDWVDADMYEVLLAAILENNADISEIGVKYVYDDRIDYQNEKQITIMNKTEALSAFLDRTKMIQGCVWGKLYKANIVKDNLFPVGRIHEDGYFTYKALYAAQKYVLLNTCKYNYRQGRIGSIMTSTIKENPKSYYDVIDAFEERNAFFESKNETIFLRKSKAYYYKTLVSFLRSAVSSGMDEDLILYLKNKIESQNTEILTTPELGLWKIKYVLFRMTSYRNIG